MYLANLNIIYITKVWRPNVNWVKFSVYLAVIVHASEVRRTISALFQEILEGVVHGKRVSCVVKHFCKEVQHLTVTKSLTSILGESDTMLNPNVDCTQWWFG